MDIYIMLSVEMLVCWQWRHEVVFFSPSLQFFSLSPVSCLDRSSHQDHTSTDLFSLLLDPRSCTGLCLTLSVGQEGTRCPLTCNGNVFPTNAVKSVLHELCELSKDCELLVIHAVVAAHAGGARHTRNHDASGACRSFGGEKYHVFRVQCITGRV